MPAAARVRPFCGASARPERIIQRSQYPRSYKETDRVDTSAIPDDWDKVVTDSGRHTADEILTDDDEGGHFAEEVVMYQYTGAGRPPDKVKRTRSVNGKRKRRYDEFRTGPCYYFPYAEIPEPLVHLPAPDPSASAAPRESGAPPGGRDRTTPSTGTAPGPPTRPSPW